MQQLCCSRSFPRIITEISSQNREYRLSLNRVTVRTILLNPCFEGAFGQATRQGGVERGLFLAGAGSLVGIERVWRWKGPDFALNMCLASSAESPYHKRTVNSGAPQMLWLIPENRIFRCGCVSSRALIRN